MAVCSPTLPAISKTLNNKIIITPLQAPFIQERKSLDSVNEEYFHLYFRSLESRGRGLGTPGDNVHTGPSWPGRGGRDQTSETRAMRGGSGDWSPQAGAGT